MRAFAMGRLIVFMLTIMAGGVVWIVQGVDHAVNYTRVSARVDRIEVSCFRPGGSAAEFRSGDNPRDNMDCDKYRSRDRQVKTTLHLRYVSPVDNREHETDMRLIDYKKPLPEKGGIWDVLASKSEADKVIKL